MPTVSQPQVTPQTFATALLQKLGAPATPQNVSSLVGWQAREGGNWNNTAKYNPLNTTQKEPGSGDTGSQGDIGVYKNWGQGLKATVDTLNNGDYGDIVGALKSGKGLSGSLAGLHTWSGGGYSSIDGSPTVTAAKTIPGVLTAPAAPGAPKQPTLTAPKITAPTGPTAQQKAHAQLVTSILQQNGVGAGLSSSAQGMLYSNVQANILKAHGDLQNLAGPAATLTVHASTGDGGSKLADMTKAANSLVGKPYVWGGGHESFKSAGYDCSGFVSAVLHAGGYLKTPQTTQTLAQQPTIANGPGKFVTVYDRTDAGIGEDHTIINLNGAWYEAGGQSGPWGGGGGVERIQKPSSEYLGSFNRQLHPLGL
jgi:cell wall-associated NlpC family hydrolase